MIRLLKRIIFISYLLLFTYACFNNSFSLISIGLGYCVLGLLFLSFSIKRNPLLFFYNVYVIVFFLPRLYFFYFFPDIFGKIDSDGINILSPRSNLVDDVLFFFSIYYLITYLYIYIINYFFPLKLVYRKRFENDLNEFKVFRFLKFYLVVNVLTSVFINFVGINMLGDSSPFNFLYRILSIPVLTIYFVYIMLFYSSFNSKSIKKLIIINFILIFISNILLGSRSFLLTIILSAIMINYIKRIHDWTNLKVSFMNVSILFIISISAWYFGTSSRQGQLLDFDIQATLFSIASRMGGGAVSFISVLNTADFQVIQKHHSWLDSLWKGVNSIIPGDIFNVQSNITAGQLFKQDVYSNFTGEFHGDYWSGFGYFYAVSGFWISIFEIFLIVLCFQLVLYFQSLSQSMWSFLFSVELIIIFCESFLLQGSSDSIVINSIVSLFTFVVFKFIASAIYVNPPMSKI